MTLLQRKCNKIAFLLTCLCSCLACAIPDPPAATDPSPALANQPYSPHFHWMATLIGGLANLKASGDSQSFTGADDNIYSYTNQGKRENTELIGAFISAERQLRNPKYFIQGGIQYNYFGSVKINGTNSVGIEPETSTIYNYRYNIQAQQLLIAAKLLTTTHRKYHPYVFAGIGLSFNQANQYYATTSEAGCVNLTPGFGSNTQTSFSYAVGIGVDTDINKNVRLGLGYMFADLGRFSLGNGRVTYNQYSYPVTFSPGSSHIYTNSLLMQIIYRGNE